MPTFPLPFRPKESYHERPRAFGCPRDGGKRKHAGCDLYAPVGTPVYAIANGVVVRELYPFYDGVYAVEIAHPDIGTVRYGEIKQDSITTSFARVIEGEIIGYVGKMRTIQQSMLHFELFDGDGKGNLTQRDKPPYSRRSDLRDPTALLDSLQLKASPTAV